MRFQITLHRKALVTLGAGALAITAVACGSAIPTAGSGAGNPPPSPLGNESSEVFGLGAPDGIGLSGGTPQFASDINFQSSGDSENGTATSGSVAAGFPGEAVISDPLPFSPYPDCGPGWAVEGATHELFIEGEPVTPYPMGDGLVYELPISIDSFSPGVPESGYSSVGVSGTAAIETAVERYVESGVALGMPVPTLYDVPEMVVAHPDDGRYGENGIPVPTLYGLPEPMPVDAVAMPPQLLPTPELADASTEAAPPPIAVPAFECVPGDPEPGVSIEPVYEGRDLSPDGSASNSGEGLPDGAVVVDALIEGARVSIAESYPPQYFLWVASRLSNGATMFGDYGVKRDGNVVAVTVTNYVQPDVSAAQFYGIHETNIALGSGFASGEVYSVVVNGEPITELTAQ
ncbi:MAG: hypothetical protein O2921_01635 [Chloroflexi bacterium]|nr:hypothetical protein [Chloroflexota bacterium]